MTAKLENVSLLLSDARGVYIPRDFVEGFDLSKWEGINPRDIEICKNPEHECYWDSWSGILDSAAYTAPDGRVFCLHQDGDLWALCYESMTAEERDNFGMDPE